MWAQNSGTNVTFRIVNYNAGASSGTWYVYDTAGSAAPDLAVQGIVTQVLSTNPPAATPVFSLLTFTNNQFQFTLAGTTSSSESIVGAGGHESDFAQLDAARNQCRALCIC